MENFSAAYHLAGVIFSWSALEICHYFKVNRFLSILKSKHTAGKTSRRSAANGQTGFSLRNNFYKTVA